MTLEEARSNLGATVHYRAGGMRPSAFEPGTITSVNDEYVFVRYEGDYHGKATRPADLTLIGKP